MKFTLSKATLLRNKYILLTLVFVVWMAFFDQNNMISQIKLYNEIRTMEENRLFYENEIKEVELELSSLLEDNQKLEKFAREKYLMKAKNEDIFLIVDKDPSSKK